LLLLLLLLGPLLLLLALAPLVNRARAPGHHRPGGGGSGVSMFQVICGSPLSRSKVTVKVSGVAEGATISPMVSPSSRSRAPQGGPVLRARTVNV